MIPGFVKINNRIFDEREYERQALLLREFLFYKIREVAEQNSFAIEKQGVFYNKELDLVLTIGLKNRHRPERI